VRNIKIAELSVDANGAETDWTGSYTDVQSADTNSIQSSTVGDISTFGIAKATTPILSSVRAVAVNFSGASGSGDLQAVLRKGGTNYLSSDLGAEASTKGLGNVWNSDPSGGSFGDIDDVAGLEVGVKSVT